MLRLKFSRRLALGSLAMLFAAACGQSTNKSTYESAYDRAPETPHRAEQSLPTMQTEAAPGNELIKADLIISGGPIYTGTYDTPPPEAVAVIDGRIAFVGSSNDALAMSDTSTKIIDLDGAALYPGFVDGHAHLYGIGERELTLNLEGTASVAELVSRVGAAVSALAPGEVLVGSGWIETGWPEKRFPTREDIDPVSGDNPVILQRADGHALLANTAALGANNITQDTPNPFGGHIVKDANGVPNGMLIDNAMNLVSSLIETPTKQRAKEGLIVGGNVYAAYGWTGVHNMFVNPEYPAYMSELSETGELGIRVYNAIEVAGLEALAQITPVLSENGRIITRAVKMFADGALGSRGAALSKPYSDAPDTDGLLLMNEATALQAFQTAAKNGIQIATHAIGDRGNRLVLNWYEKTFASNDINGADLRWRIEHSQVLHKDDIPRFSELGVIASMQPSHAIGDLYFAPARLGLQRLDGAYAWRSIIDSGALIVGGSDAPVERGDPRIEFYAAIARKGLDGYSDENWRRGQAVTRKEALKMFTLWPAYASFQEDDLGTIEVGKKADFTAFSVDFMTAPAEQILEAETILTMVDGNIIYRAKDD